MTRAATLLGHSFDGPDTASGSEAVDDDASTLLPSPAHEEAPPTAVPLTLQHPRRRHEARTYRAAPLPDAVRETRPSWHDTVVDPFASPLLEAGPLPQAPFAGAGVPRDRGARGSEPPARTSHVQVRPRGHDGWYGLERDLHEFVAALRLPREPQLEIEGTLARAPEPLRVGIANVAADLARLFHGTRDDLELQVPVRGAATESCLLVAALGEALPGAAARVRALHLDSERVPPLSLRHLRLGFRGLEVIWAPANPSLRDAMAAPELQVALWKRRAQAAVTRGADPHADHVTFFERWTVAFGRANHVESMMIGTLPLDPGFLVDEENALLILLTHPELHTQHPASRQRAYDQLDRVRGLRAYHVETAPRFAARHQRIVAQAYRSLGLVPPDFARLARPDALREIARFDVALAAQRHTIPEARQLQRLMHFHLRDLAIE